MGESEQIFSLPRVTSLLCIYRDKSGQQFLFPWVPKPLLWRLPWVCVQPVSALVLDWNSPPSTVSSLCYLGPALPAARHRNQYCREQEGDPVFHCVAGSHLSFSAQKHSGHSKSLIPDFLKQLSYLLSFPGVEISDTRNHPLSAFDVCRTSQQQVQEYYLYQKAYTGALWDQPVWGGSLTSYS